MNQNIQRLSQIILLGFGLIAVALLYWQLARAPELVARDDNPRLVQAELRVRRGRLTDRTGEIVAYSELDTDPVGRTGVVQRHYPRLEVSHVVGYYSLRYGTGGAEAAFDARLRGHITSLDELLHRPQVGNNVALSVNLVAQRVADQDLGVRRGAVLLLDVVTGEILVLVSHPAYDPNTLDADWDLLIADPNAPLLNRATQGVYPLGDLARLVGLAGLLSAGITSPPDPFSKSLDEMVAPLSERGYLAAARQFGFAAAPSFELATGPGLLPDFDDRGTLRDLAATPLHMARFAAAIASDGQMPVPTLAYPPPAPARERVFAGSVADALRAVTPRHGAIASWTGVATSQETGVEPLSWLVGYMPVSQPRYAMAIVIEGNDDGTDATLPIARHLATSLGE